jgi:hypothetical protein
MFNPNFVKNLQQALGDNLWLAKSTNYNYRTHLLCQAECLLGTNKAYQYSLVKTSCKKWPKNESDLDYDKYDLLIFKYDANQETLVQQKEGAPMEEEEGTLMKEEGEPKTPLQSTYEEGKELESTNK